MASGRDDLRKELPRKPDVRILRLARKERRILRREKI